MPIYKVQAPDGKVYRIQGPPNANPEDLFATIAEQNPMAAQTTAELEATKSAPFSFGDIAKSFGAGLIGGGKSLVDVFGAGTGVSKGLGEAQSYLQQALTPERQAEIARRQELENRAAQSGSLFQEAKAFLGGVAEAPLQSLTQAAGSSAPSILAGIAAIPVGAPAALALGVGTIAKLSVGALQGVGEYKGSVFDAVKAEYIKQGRSPVEAERLAEASQQYSREKAFEIGGSAVLGALDAVTGVEPSVGKAIRKVSPTGALTREAIEAGAAALPKEVSKAPTRIGQFLKGVAEEAPIEGAQGAFGQYGQNVALQQAGADVTPMEGVLGAGLRDAAVGALFGGAASPLGMKSARHEYQTEQFLRQAKAQLDAEKAAAEELQRKEEQRAKTEEGLGVPKMLALPAPAKPYEEPKNPLVDPVGRVTEDELGKAIGNNTVVNYINKYRKENNLPKLKSYSIEDIKDAMTAQNPEGEEGALNAILAYKTNYQNQEYTPDDIQNIAVAKNVATDTKGFSDFLTRATGKADLNTMTQPELHSVATALDALPRTGKEEQLVLPEGSNATRFTQDQYSAGITAALLGDKPVSMDEALKRVQTQKGIDSDQAAERLLRAAAANDDLTIEKGTGFQAVSATGKVLGTYASETEARRSHRRAEIKPVETELVAPRIEEAVRPEATLPEGYQIQKETTVGSEAPAAYVIREDGSQKNASQTFADEAAAKERLNILERKREANAKAEEAAADRVRQDLEKRQAAIAQMEADGKTGTPEHTKAVYAFQAADVAGKQKITGHLDAAEALRTPLKIVPLGKKSTKAEKHTVIKDGKVVASFDTNDKAQAHVLSLLDDKALESIAERGGVMGKRASVELDMRQRPGVRGATTEGLEKAGVHTPKVEAQLKELEAKLIPMLKKFGLEQVGLNVVRAIENDADGAWGRADKLIRIALQATEPIKTMRHEALHALKELGFFTDAQWEALKRQADKVWVDKYLKGVPFNETMSRYDAYANGLYDADGNTLMAPLSRDEILEEAIADAFGDWEGGAKPPPGMMAALFKRLQQFFSALRQALTGAGFESAEDIFGKIERGELRAGKEAGGAESKASVKNTTKGMLNPNIAPKYEKILEDVIKEMGLTPEEFASTSLIHQTGKAGTEQFETEKVGGLPEVIQFLQDERRKSGLPLLDIENADDRKIVAKLMATEAMAAIRSGGANLEWYDSVINKTLAMAGLKYSELNTDINARAAFRIATAITSQGLNVEDNLGFAMKVYDQFRQTGKFPEIGQGADQAAMINNFKLANYLMDDMGANLLRQFLETEFTVEELRSAGFNIAGELGDEKVLGSSVFGPKIGFGFYSNLNGNFEPVTMDMWFMRTIGRLTGKLKAFRQDLYDAQLKKFRDELDTQGSNGVFANQFDQNEIDLAKADDTAAEALARKVKSAHERDFKANRAAYDDGSRAKSKLVAASETMIKSLDSPKDAPANGSERRNLRDIVRQMVDIVEEKYGKRVPPASLQAVIWYPEQELYKALGVKLRVTSQNYAGAIEKILLGEGYGESDLESAAKLGSRTAQQVARAAVSKAAKTTGTKPVRLGSLEAEEKESLLERGRKRVVLEQEKEAPRRKRVIFEVAPDPNNKALTEKWRSLPNDTRIEISDRIGNTIIKNALEQFGLTGYVDTQVGSYLDDTNPSFALYLDSGDAVNMAKFLGFVLSQDSMMVVSPKEGKGLDETGAVRINLGDVDAAKVDDIYQKLREIEVDGEKPVGGQSFMNGHMVVLNYSNVPTSQLATLINDKLNDNYEVITENVYTAFPEKKDYDYANPSSDPRGNAGVLRQAGRDLRSEATRLLQKELKTIKPKAAPADQKLSLRQVKEIFDRAESIPEPPGVESIRRQWIGGVSGIGDRDPMYDLYRVNGSKKYIQDVQDFLRKELGDDFKGYRLMSNDELEELQTGAMGSQYASFTLNPDIARAFKNIPAYADKTGMSVVEMDLTPEHVAMIGHPGELELVVDYGQGYNPSEIKVVEKYSLRAPDTKEFKQWFGDSKIVDENGNPKVMYHGTRQEIFEPRTRGNRNAFFVSPDANFANKYALNDLSWFPEKPFRTIEEGAQVYPVYISAKNPFDYENPKHLLKIIPQFRKVLKEEEGYNRSQIEELIDDFRDGKWNAIEWANDYDLFEKNGFDAFYTSEQGRKNLGVFEPTQVKSATGNNGTYSATNPDIRYSLRTSFPTAEAAEKAAYKKAPPETPEFKRFFGASKVKEEGRPQVMYHASPNIFDQFRENKPIFVSPSPTDAEYYGKRHRTPEKMDVNIYPLWVRAETPFDFENLNHIRQLGAFLALDQDMIDSIKEGHWETIESQDVQDVLQDAGFDSFYVREGNTKNLAVFNANQVKSVTGNIGEFGENKNIRFSLPTFTQATQRRVDETTIVRENKGVISRILESFAPESLSELRAAFIHRYDRLGFYDKKLAEKMGGKVLLADVSAEAAANMSDLSSSITASVFGIGNRKGGIPVYRNGFTTVDNSVKGVIEILRPLAQFGDPSAYQHYQFWAGVKRGSRFIAEGREENFEPNDIDKAKEVYKKYLAKGVDFNVIQKEMNTFNDGLVNYMIATGVISKEKGEAFKKHMDYIPFFRQIDGEQTVGPKIYNAISGVKPPKKLKGGEAPLTDYLESIVRNAQAAINAGMKNVAAQKALNVAMQLGPQAGAQRLNVIDNAPDTVQVLENGKQVSYRVADPLFINAVKSLNMAEMPFLGMLSAPANMLRNLVTKDPGFMLANLARDSLSAWVTSGVNVTPIIGTASNFAKALAGDSPTLTALLNGGILGGYEFSSGLLNSANTLERDLNKKYSEKGSALPLKTFTGIWDALEKGTEASDAATRMAVYDRVLEETGNEAEALYRALEVMNFNRKGNSPVVRILTAAIPFLNARIQGLDVLYRTAFGRNVMENAEAAQKAFFVRGATLMALSAAYFLAVSDDDEWKKQEQETKDNYWIAPGIGKFPTPFEVGFLFKTVPERLLAYTMKDDTGQDLMDSMRRGLLNTFAFNPIPQVAKPLVEYSANYNFFTGRPIVGMGMEGKEPEYQVGPSTTKTAEMIGKSLGLSPLKIDQLISGYTGTMGMYLMTAVDSVLDSQSNSPNASKRFEQLPVIKRFAADPEARGNITQYYELKRAVDAAVETQNYLLKAGKPEEYADFVEKNAGLLAVKSYVSNMEKSMKQLRDMRKVVQGAEMTADEKRDTITAIGQAENNMTQNIQTIKKLVSEYQ